MLLSRRLIPDAYNHKLGTLADHLNIKIGKAHRALDDAKATAKIWGHLHKTVRDSTGISEPSAHIFSTINKKPKRSIDKYFEQIRN